MLFNGKSGEYLKLENVDSSNCNALKERIESGLTLVWFLDDDSIFQIDGREFIFQKNQIITLTEFHGLKMKSTGQVKMIRFNRQFFCILDHDSEVSCKGLLFFGASNLPIISLPDKEVKKFEMLWSVFEMEMESADELQLEMLQMLLKRLLILLTRLYKMQDDFSAADHSQMEQVREFNFLVEQHFKTKHSVAEYAELMFKSPKTLSNLFSKLGAKTPLQYIRERIMLEARRLLTYTDLSIKEVAYEIGYEDIPTFSRFFKKNEGISPSDFKEKVL
ncbi:MAG: helix-turn-helix domain-containing protein [Flavobacteriales bacterium]